MSRPGDKYKVGANSGREAEGPAGGEDKLKKVQREVDEVKNVMSQNIDKVMARGEKLEHLTERTDELSSHANTFKKRSTQLKTHMWLKNLKLQVAIVLVVLLILFFIIGGICNFDFSKCGNNKK